MRKRSRGSDAVPLTGTLPTQAAGAASRAVASEAEPRIFFFRRIRCSAPLVPPRQARGRLAPLRTRIGGGRYFRHGSVLPARLVGLARVLSPDSSVQPVQFSLIPSPFQLLRVNRSPPMTMR